MEDVQMELTGPRPLNLRVAPVQDEEPAIVSLKSNLTNEEELELLKESLEILLFNMDSLFLIIMGSLIILMQAGFGFLEAGSVRAKNTTNILIKNYADLCFGSMAFWFIGYGLAFGEGNGFIGYTHLFALDLPFQDYAMLFFQCTFAATCATIVSGAIAERCNFNGYVIFSIIITGITYPMAAHWCWGPYGWLGQLGFRDFAGSGVVHLSGGVCALVGAIVLGPRIDRFKDKNSTFISGHSIPHVSLGGFILIFGFMAFNAGSQGSVSQKGDGEAISVAALSTLVGCASGGITVLFTWKFHPIGRVWSLSRIINGCLAGMVAVCAGCNKYYPWIAGIIGCVAGIIYISLSLLMVKLKIDDPLDAVAVHAGSGLWGLLAAPLFRTDGLILSGSADSLNMLIWNAVGAAVLAAFHAITSGILFIGLHKLDLFRVPPDAEKKGLDILKHNEPAYGFESMWPGLDELKTLSKRMQMEADLEKQSRHLKTPPSGNDMSNGFYSDGNIMKRASRKITAVNTIKHGPTMLMPEVAH